MLELDATGSSLPAIALDVFGDRRLYGRVRRLLSSTRAKTTDDQQADAEVAAALDVILTR